MVLLSQNIALSICANGPCLAVLPWNQSEELPEMTIESPCIGRCQLDDQTFLCLGCWRSLSEIAAWSQSEEAERLRVLAAIQTRKVLYDLERTKERS